MHTSLAISSRQPKQHSTRKPERTLSTTDCTREKVLDVSQYMKVPAGRLIVIGTINKVTPRIASRMFGDIIPEFMPSDPFSSIKRNDNADKVGKTA